MSAPSGQGALGPGTEIDGFSIEAVAGRGGMGVVYRARQRQPERVVALKVIADDLATDPAFRARFRRESNIAAQIEHPHVIPVYAVGEADGVLYIAMRFVDGTDMHTLQAQAGRLEPRRAAAIIDQVARALDAAHAHGLVHRDVKPANILISATDGRDHVYLSDFGLSRHVEGSHGLTGSGAFLGTIDYVAPEQARGERVDARTDVYSLGCVLFHMLTGTVPFPLDNDLAKLYAHDRQPPPSARERAPDLPPQFEAVLARAMAKAPDDRYLSAGDLGRAALAAASEASLSRAERNVAVGGAAPPRASPVPARPAATAVGGGLTTDAAADATAADATAADATAADATAADATAADATAADATAVDATAAEATAAEATAAAPEHHEPSAIGPAAPASQRRRLRLAGALAGAAVAVAAGVVVLTSGGPGNPAPTKPPPARKPATASAPATTSPPVGIVPGQRIGEIALGETRGKVTAALVNSGYTAQPGAGANATFTSRRAGAGVFTVFFERGAAILVQKFNDPSIRIAGISIDSTLREAQAALPSWQSVRCPKTLTLLIAPLGHTYFEFPHGLDTTNTAGSNGIGITAGKADRTFC